MKRKLNIEERSRMEDLLIEAKKRNETYVSSIIQLALDMDEKGKYDKFIEVFSESK